MTEKSQSNRSPKNDSGKNPCSICRASGNPPPCKGHGRGSSSGGDSSKDNATKSSNIPQDSALNRIGDAILTQHSELNSIVLFDRDVISELLSKQLLAIDNNREIGILSIKCNPLLLSEDQKKELKKFVDVLIAELDTFKNENGISVNCAVVEKDNRGNLLTLRITLPTPKAYDKFINQLSSKKLLPTPSPLAMNSATDSGHAVRSENEEAMQTEKKYKSPFSIDGPKPNGHQ